MLADIVKTYGGDLFNGGMRALIPGPGHSPNDRSVSLFIGRGDVVRAHCFSDTPWQEVLATLRKDGLIDADGRVQTSGRSSASSTPMLSDPERIKRAEDIWSRCIQIDNSLSEKHLRERRQIDRDVRCENLRHCPSAPLRVYSHSCRSSRPAMTAKISDWTGKLVGVELQYLQANAARTTDLNHNRKTVGHLKPYKGIAVRIDTPADELLIGEGIATTLSASDEYSLPCWAVLSSNNFDTFIAPEGLKRLVIACERDKIALGKSNRLAERMSSAGIKVFKRYAPLPYKDFNEYRGGQP